MKRTCKNTRWKEDPIVKNPREIAVQNIARRLYASSRIQNSQPRAVTADEQQ